MLNPSLYTSIFTRKSIRNYTGTPLSPAQLNAVKKEIKQAVPLLPDESYQLELLQVKDAWRICGYCENTPLSNANLGFVMQQLDLALYLQGLGRVWFGMGREPAGQDAPEGLSYAICQKIGNAEDLSRAHVDEFTRSPMQAIAPGADDAMLDILEPARLAPSATNAQPWRFSFAPGKLHVWRKNPGLKKPFLGRMNQVDMGIMLCHLVLSLEHAGKAFAIANDVPAAQPGGCDYLLTLEF